MKSISLKELRQNLSKYTAEASKGTPILVTRFRKPFVRISAAQTSSLHVGSRVGTGSLRSIASLATQGAYLKEITKDRDRDT